MALISLSNKLTAITSSPHVPVQQFPIDVPLLTDKPCLREHFRPLSPEQVPVNKILPFKHCLNWHLHTALWAVFRLQYFHLDMAMFWWSYKYYMRSFPKTIKPFFRHFGQGPEMTSSLFSICCYWAYLRQTFQKDARLIHFFVNSLWDTFRAGILWKLTWIFCLDWHSPLHFKESDVNDITVLNFKIFDILYDIKILKNMMTNDEHGIFT